MEGEGPEPPRPTKADPRIESIVAALFNISLDAVPPTARETDVGRVLASGLGDIKAIPRRGGIGIDGSSRTPDDARRVPGDGQLPALDLAIEYKLYRDRKQAAGEMDRGLGQCLAYAEQYEAVLFFVIYMGAPRDTIPNQWLDRAVPLLVGHLTPGVPVYFAARPRSWSDAWAASFRR